MTQPRIQRSVSATWPIQERWGSQLGDTRDYSVTRSGERVSFRTKDNPSFDRDLARQIGQALIDAANWEDPHPIVVTKPEEAA